MTQSLAELTLQNRYQTCVDSNEKLAKDHPSIFTASVTETTDKYFRYYTASLKTAESTSSLTIKVRLTTGQIQSLTKG